jgi:hypothetical protein
MKKLIICWSLRQLHKMYHSKKDFGEFSDFGIDDIIDFTDGNLCIHISDNKQKKIVVEQDSIKHRIPVLKVVK